MTESKFLLFLIFIIHDFSIFVSVQALLIEEAPLHEMSIKKAEDIPRFF